jgi:hypothetical protein
MSSFVTAIAPETRTATGPHAAPAAAGGIVYNRRIRVDEQAARIPVPGTASIVGPSAAEPRVELVRDKGVVRSILVRCPCGRCTQLNCDYE